MTDDLPLLSFSPPIVEAFQWVSFLKLFGSERLALATHNPLILKIKTSRLLQNKPRINFQHGVQPLGQIHIDFSLSLQNLR